MVTTPQGLAGLIVRKTVHMAQSIGVPIAGVVENMAYFVCPDCGKRHIIFGDSHAKEVAETANAPLLTQLPMDPQIATLCDTGKIEEINIAGIPEFLQSFLKAIQALPEKKND